MTGISLQRELSVTFSTRDLQFPLYMRSDTHAHTHTHTKRADDMMKHNLLVTHIQILVLAHANTHKHTDADTHTGHREVAVTVIGSCCRRAKPAITNYLSLYSTAALAVWMPPLVCVSVCVCVCVIVGEIGKLLVIYFSMLKRKEEKCREGGRGGERSELFEEAGAKNK